MTQEERYALQRWTEHHKALAADVPVEDWLSQSEIDKKRKRLEADTIEWIKYFFPKYAKYEFAPFHVRAIKRVIEHDEWYEVLSWSRELAKSTVAMFILMYLALTGRKKFFVIASATIDSAKRLLAPYKINFESNPRIRQFYGTQQTLGQWMDGEFTARCGAKFIALGAGSSPRGARNEEVRPDVICMDDYDTDEDCRNPETLKKKWDWFEQALYPTRSISEPTLILWCGNIIAKDCCIKKAGAKARHWDIVNIRDKDGHSTWPQKNTEEQIDTVLANISTKNAQAEYFNNPVSEGSIFKYLPFGKVPPLRRFKFLILYGDPAYSDSKKKASSTKALWLIGKYKGVYYIIKGFLARELNATFISWYFDILDYVGGKTNVYCYMENNKLQDPFFNQVFKPLLHEECKRRGKQVYIKGDERRKTDKATRIEANLEPIDRNGAWIFNEAERDNPHMQELMEQFKLFEMHLPYNADGPDCIEGGITMLESKVVAMEPTVTISYEELNEDNPFRM
nr:MAG TPA: Large Terminase [Caudoviricetes sp.]